MGAESNTVWYFAYGSNMSSEKFTGRRGIVPLKTARVCLPNWSLTMEIPGLPYSEPAFSSIVRRVLPEAESGRSPDVVGIAYLITNEQYRHVIASEGGGTAYNDIGVVGDYVDLEGTEKTGRQVMVRTLSSAMKRYPVPAPSQRYMTILKEGAKEAQLPSHYQEYLSEFAVYEPPKSAWTKLGAFLFLAMWTPVMQILESVTMRSIKPDGNAPRYVVIIVRVTMATIWASHDNVFAPLFGRGDGYKRQLSRTDLNRKTSETTRSALSS